MKLFQTLLAGLALTSSMVTHAQEQQLTTVQLNDLYTTAGGSVYSIHDPSVVFKDGKFTIFGSHMGTATSSDLINWAGNRENWARVSAQGATTSTACARGDAFITQRVKTVKNYKGETVTMKNFNAMNYCCHYNDPGWLGGNCWAPDIIYNTAMKKWCMYLSLNGPHWNSIIIMLSANSSTGPFTYEGPVVMGGFNGQSYDGKSAPGVEMTDLELATGETSLPERYRKGNYGSFWPNCIDPCVFYDEEGELWMSYGSWSGGIFILKLDKETGLRDYTVYYADESDKRENGLSDPYFGKKIAGGYYVSGEASYIQHIGEYYYLFMTYGGLDPDGGYEMRIFRSKNPDGPYTDGSGTLATYTSGRLNYGPGGDNRGMKITGAYNHWGNQEVGETAEGHNSACADDKGRNFVMYHTKFNDGSVGFQIRAHQLFVNEKGWLVEGPFNYRGEKTTDEDIKNGCPWTNEEIAGEYNILIHPYNLDHKNMQEATPQKITLNANGRVTGDYTGTWAMKEGTAYLTLKLGTATYYGVVIEQEVNGATRANYRTTSLKAIAFSGVSNGGVPVWGYKLQPKYALAYNYKNNSAVFTGNIKNATTYNHNLSLMFPTTDDVKLSWTSSQPEIISETGKYNPTGLTENTPVTMVARMSCGDYYWEQSYSIKAKYDELTDNEFLNGMVAYYDFDEKPTYNHYKFNDGDYDRVTYNKFGTDATAAFQESDYERDGSYVHVLQGESKANSYARIPNPLLENDTLKGVTISAWVKRAEKDVKGDLWGFYNATSASSTTSGKFFLSGNAAIGYDDAKDNWMKINALDEKETVYDVIPVGEWAYVTLTMGEQNGIRLYVNGSNKVLKTISSSYEMSGSTVNSKTKTLPLEEMAKMLTTQKYFYLGHGSGNGSANACFDNLVIYARELSTSEVSTLNKVNNRVFDLAQGEGGTTGITSPTLPDMEDSNMANRGMFDLSGRKMNNITKHGIYIVNGKKVVR